MAERNIIDIASITNAVLDAAVEKGEMTAEQAKKMREDRNRAVKQRRDEERQRAAEARAREALHMEEERDEFARHQDAVAEYKRKMAVLMVTQQTGPARYYWRYFIGPWPVNPEGEPFPPKEHHQCAWGCFAFGCCQCVSGEYEPLCMNALNAATCVIAPWINPIGCMMHNCPCHM